MKKQQLLTAVALAAMALATAACSGGESNGTPVAVVPPPPPTTVTPPPPPPPTSANLDVTPCLNQMAAGRRVQDILIPDILDLDLSQPAGFPNGRDLDDPVIDLTLAAIFLRISATQPVDTLVRARVNPFMFDQPLRTTFPFYAPPIGTPTLSPSTGTNFNFRTDPASNYVRVDRAGIPAVSTATVLGANKLAYNDSNPTQDAAGVNVPRILEGYQLLTNSLNDDFRALGLTPCAT